MHPVAPWAASGARFVAAFLFALGEHFFDLTILICKGENKMARITISVMCLSVALSCAFTAHAVVTFDWATVGNPGNADDIHGAGYGGVDYAYNISKHEVTNGQYVEFLNAVDPDWRQCGLGR